MLTEDQNVRLTRVGPGTPMGELLRRYWMPVAAVSQLDREAVKPLRLFGEDLVLYRDARGSYGLVEDERFFADRRAARLYAVEAKAGLIWAYLGPRPVPLVPAWEPFTWANGFVQIVFATIPCNWLQCQENSIDPVHFEWMHRNWTVRLNGETGPYGKKHVRVGFDEFEYGFVYKRLVEGMPETHPRWQMGRICLWPNCLGPLGHSEWRVPIDDTTTLSVTWHFSRVPIERQPYVQTSIPAWEGPIVDPLTGRWITSHVMNQDFVAWVGQGAIADRTKEHLGVSDRGVIAMRKRFFEDLDCIERGEDPKGIVRDPAVNVRIDLPIIDKHIYIDGLPLAEMLADPSLDPRMGYRFQAGQPDDVRSAYLDAMGVDPDASVDAAGAQFLASAGAASSRRMWT